jgi:hypothetical protein
LVVGQIYREPAAAESCWRELEERFGPLDFLSPVRPFDFTAYYERELGASLLRRWGTFARLLAPDGLTAVKLATNALEDRLRAGDKRTVNLDPGLLSAERLVLATGKNYVHRLYLGRGIFGDLTLIYARGSFQPLPWTYPDYQDPEAIGMFNRLRERYLLQLRRERGGVASAGLGISGDVIETGPGRTSPGH